MSGLHGSAIAFDRAVTRSLHVLPTLLALVAEAAWTSIFAALMQAFVLRGPVLGIPAMLAAAVGGVVAARVLVPRLGERWPWVAVVLAIGVGVLGWMAGSEVRDILASRGVGGLADAVVANPGGSLAAVAFVRGIAQSRMPPDPRSVATTLALGVPGLAVAALLGGMAADPWRSRYLAEAQAEVLVFLLAGILALALSRLTMVGSASGVDWRRNPTWIGLLLLLSLGVAGAAVTASLVAGPAIVMVLGAIVPSLLLFGLVIGFDRRSLRILGLCAVIALLIAQFLSAVGARPRQVTPLPTTGLATTGDQSVPGQLVAGVVAIVIVVAVALAIVLVRLWMRRPRAPEDDLDETRWIDRGETTEAARTVRRRRGGWLRRAAPADAVAAYRELIDDLETHARVRREPAETPAEHAGRLRAEGTGSLGLDLLAADYGLARFAGVRLTASEDRRAIDRARRLRRALLEAAARLPGPKGPRGGPQERPGEAAGPEGQPSGARSRFRVG